MNHFTRRELLYGAGAVLGNVAFRNQAALGQGASSQGVRYALMVPPFYSLPGSPKQGWPFWPTKPLHETAIFLEHLGFQGIDICDAAATSASPSSPLPSGSWGLSPESMLEALEGTNIRVSDVGGLCQFENPDSRVRARAVEIDRKCLELAKTLGSPTIGEHYTPASNSLEANDWLVINSLKQLIPDVKRTGVEVVLEPMYNPKATQPIDLQSHAARMIQAIGAPGFKVVSDYWHMTMQKNDVGKDLARDGKYTGAVHVSEDGLKRTEPGSTGFDYRPGFRALKKWGYSGWLSIECRPSGNDPAASLARALKYIQRQWNEA